jgi:hypothetical protein
MPSLSALVQARSNSRVWASTIASLLIVGAFAAFYMQRYHEAREQAAARSVRLLGTGAEAVRKAASGGSLLIVEHPQCPTGIQVVPPRADTVATAPNAASEKPAVDGVCLPFSDVLGFVPKGAKLFDKIMLVDGNDAVKWRVGSPSAPNFLSLNELRVLDSAGKKVADHAKQKDFGSAALVEAGGERSQLSCQPLINDARRYDATGAGTPITLHLCGMVSEARMVKEAVAVSPLFVTLFSVLLICALLVPPFLKTALLSFTERLRFVDVVTVGLCVFAWLMLATVVGESAYAYQTLRDQSADRLEALNHKVAEKLRIEVAGWQAVLATLDVPAYAAALKAATIPRPPNSQHIEAIALADMKGDQIAKWRDPGNGGDLVLAPSLANVASRRYFKNALASPRGTLVIDSVKTFTSGETRAVFAKRVTTGSFDGIVTLTAALAAVDSAKLPSTIGFALVDRDGWVAFHSDDALSSSHNLFDETDQNETLRKLVSDPNGRDKVEQLSYWGIDQQAYVDSMNPPDAEDTKLKPNPWSIVTFEEVEPLRRAVFIAGATALEWCGAYLVFCALIFGAFVTAGKRNLSWSWPNPHGVRAYQKLGRAYAGLGVLPIVAWCFFPTWGLRAALVLPPLLVLATAIVYKVPDRSVWKQPASSISHWAHFQWTSGVFWFVVTAVPAGAIGLSTIAEALSRNDQAGTAAWKLTAAQFTNRSGDLFVAHEGYLEAWRGVHGEAWSLLSAWKNARIVAGSLALDLVIAAIIVFWGLKTVFLRGVEQAPSRKWHEAFDDLMGDQPNAPARLWCVVPSRAQLKSAQEAQVRAGAADISPVYVESARDLWAALPAVGDTSIQVPRLFLSPRSLRQMFQLARTELGEATSIVCQARLAGTRTICVQDLDPADRKDAQDELVPPAIPANDQAAAEPSAAANDAETDEAPAGPVDTLVKALMGDGADGALWWHDRRRKWLTRELEVSSHVFDACQRNIQPGSLAGVEEDELRRVVRDACWDYYLEVWQACSSIERLTLLQLSQEAFINQKRVDVVRDLLSRGVLLRRPVLAPMTDSFGLFVCAMGADENLTSLEVSTHRLSWDNLKMPLFTLLVCSAGAFFYTQRALFDTTLVFATTLTSILPQVGRWVALLGIAPARVAGAAPVTPANIV